MIILLTGMPGSGKGEIARAFKRAGVPVVSMGDTVREEADKRGIPKTPEGLKALSIELRKEMGEDAIARLAIPKVRKLLEKRSVVVVEGIRSPAEVEAFRRAFPREKVLIVAVHSPPHQRFERLRRRKRSDDPRTWEEFVDRDKKELGFGIGEVIALADYMIVNDGHLEDYRLRIRELISKLLPE
ncbi:AAA family ATPase [Pyrococcus yayanosii]|uniref:UPF0200 protein PYCH_09240 n=1 Tax=Pyrococcus yayanosii (strain CH1 / JCM 16557) TaxID=529709 RepID=F8AE98_PYRYC|nr:AAA family ATPase [Pyrococcus yayanosii]AEH24609.1 Dephospho-CoA kinase [Pyrococcus yayanosii CH1]